MTLEYTDLTVSAIQTADPYFRIPPDYIEPSEYPLFIDINQYRQALQEDIDKAVDALYGSIMPLLQFNVCGYSLGRPIGLRGRSEFTLNLANTACVLYSEIMKARRCINDRPFCVAVCIPKSEEFNNIFCF